MLSSQKRIFAGKQGLHAEPFCPYISNDTGYSSLRRSFENIFTRPGQPPQSRPSLRSGRSHT